MTNLQIVISILLSLSVLLGISLMSRVKTSVAGNRLSACAILLGVLLTLYFHDILSAWTVFVALAIGAVVGLVMATRAQMIQMPQLVALFNGLGGGASALVGIMSYMDWGIGKDASLFPTFSRLTAILAVIIGMITLVGSLVAAGKLSRIINQRPIVFKCHTLVTNLILLAILSLSVFMSLNDISIGAIICLVLITSGFGYMFAIRVGGADMPITISLLNSLSGVAGAIAGMAVNDIFLVSVGGIVGASGLLLTQIMCRAMNRSLSSILLGRTAKTQPSPKHHSGLPKTDAPHEFDNFEQFLEQLNDMEIKQFLDAMEELTKEVRALREEISKSKSAKTASSDETIQSDTSPASILSRAKDVIIVPGYGMALAQAQHMVKQLADTLEMRGTRVRFAIHPVAGRMPGHMNVLLAEADIAYDKLFEMDAINNDFKNTDAVVVIGANDVLNPAARNAEGTPIYGMPVLAVDQAPQVIICNYDLKPGYAGVENPLYTRQTGVSLCLGDAKKSLATIINNIK